MTVQQPMTHAPVHLPVGTRVLIVEDQPFVALAVADMVVSLGGEVAGSAATVEEALAAVGRGGFTVALLDVDLGGRTSEAVAAALAAADLPFLVTTGFNDRAIPGLEAAPALLKPYLPNHLGAALMALVDPQANAA